MRRYRSKDLRKGRFSEIDRVYLITTNTIRRDPLFAQWQIGRLVCHQLRQEQDERHAVTIAWVVMPDHLHWLMQLKKGSLADVMQRVKARSALAINQALARSGPVWQRGFHDRALRRDDDLKSAARYVIANPVRAGLVAHVGQYPLWDAMWLEARG
jgi:putative transposase